MTHPSPHHPRHRERRRHPPTPSSSDIVFEFIGHDSGTEMCAADDIFLQGQLLPHKYKPPTTPSPRTTTNAQSHLFLINPRHRKFESLEGFKQRSGGDYQRLQTIPEATEPRRSRPGGKRSEGASFETSGRVATRPKWYMVVFGSVTVPAEMEIKDMKSRQKRRNTSRLGLGSDDRRRRNGPVAGVGCEGQAVGGSWNVLRTLSCKGDVDGVVTATSVVGFT